MEAVPKIVRQRLAQASARVGARPEAHPDADVLTAFSEQSLPAQEREQVLLHLAACGDCRDVVALAAPELGSEAAANAAARVPAAGRARWSWIAARWGTAAATLVIAVGAVVLYQAQQPARNQTAGVTLTPTPKTSKADEARAQASGGGRETGEAPTLAAKRPAPAAPPQLSADARRAAAFGDAARAPRPLEIAATTPPPPQLEAKTLMAKRAAPAAERPAELVGDVIVEPQATSGTTSSAAFINAGGLDQAAPAPQPTLLAQSGIAQSGRTFDFKDLQIGGSSLDSQKHKTSMIEHFKAGALRSAFAGRQGAIDESDRTRLPASDWEISIDGHVHKRLTDGKWHEVTVAPGVFFRAIAARLRDVWVGGSAGTLFHSSDAGTQWARVSVSNGERLHDDIVRIQIGDTSSVTLATANGEVWATSDGGQHWQHLQTE